MRKTKMIIITEKNRDEGKRYWLTEMPASRAEKWAARAFLAMAHAGVEVPEGISNAGFAGIALLGLRSLTNLKWEEAEPLLDEMMDCVQIMPDLRHDEIKRPLLEDDIEEISTRVMLRSEVFQLHVDFSLADEKPTSDSSASATSNSSNTQTSQHQSAA